MTFPDYTSFMIHMPRVPIDVDTQCMQSSYQRAKSTPELFAYATRAIGHLNRALGDRYQRVKRLGSVSRSVLSGQTPLLCRYECFMYLVFGEKSRIDYLF